MSISFIKGGDNPFLNLGNSMANNWIYLLCMDVELSFSRSSVKKDVKSVS